MRLILKAFTINVALNYIAYDFDSSACIYEVKNGGYCEDAHRKNFNFGSLIMVSKH